jgi:G3E family GTPase
VQVLRDPGIAKAVELRASICVVDPEQLSDRRYLENEVYREQIAEAAAIYVSKTDARRGVQRDRVQTDLQAFGSGAFVVFSDDAGLTIERFDAAATRKSGPC